MTIEPKSTLLSEALELQKVRKCLVERRTAQGESDPDFQEKLIDYVLARNDLAMFRPHSAIEALILTHQMERAANSIGHCIDGDDINSLRIIADELLAAIAGLISFNEQQAGYSRANLGLETCEVAETLH